MISNLLKTTTVQHAAQIIGHNDINSTMSYQRYALSKKEIQDFTKIETTNLLNNLIKDNK